jgi:hypothetical protein
MEREREREREREMRLRCVNQTTCADEPYHR